MKSSHLIDLNEAMMVNVSSRPLSIKNLKKDILNKALERNDELKKNFYSCNTDEYEFVDINNFQNYKLLLFRCPKSKSTISIRINQE